ncbi:protein-disulfide reductase DsbD [Propionivibrio sp.]|uniref:protein-disulfide reductase DsbD n=1 Tax=Propionivibrio sp. TaxID=2212460 RepID=UPI00272E6A0A|nr:protein-disulfide reductase DsbD [Propionivibrio sp.]
MKRAFCFALFWLLPTIAGAAGLLPPEQAFRPSASALDGQTVEVRFDIADGYYLYRDKFRFAVEPDTLRLGTPALPPGKEKMDDTFGQVEVYYREVAIRLPVERNSSGNLPLVLHVTSQGCADLGVCYPPLKQTLSVELFDSPDPSAVPAAPAAGNDESGRIAAMLANASSWWVAISFFGFGLLLSLTPCTFPMIPILSGIIVGAGRDGQPVSRGRAFALSLAYVFGMALTHAVAGVAAGLTGTLISAALQNAWVLGGMALIFVVLALSMFGLFELQMPSFLQSRISEESAQLRGGHLPAVALMGALSSLVVGPCVAAPLAGALLYIGGTGDALLGGLALFCLALGMGVPLLAVGLSAGSLLPKAGPWMAAINKVFGVVLLASALWIVSPLIPVVAQMLAWALLLIVPAIYLHALDPLPPQAHGWQRFGKAVGVVMLLTGAAMLVGVLSGARDPLQPLARIGMAGGSEVRPLPFERVRSLAELDARIASAGRPVMLDFYADWCVSCKEMERFTFADPRVRARLSGWLLLQADVTANSAEDKALLAHFKLFGPPGIVFFDPSGREVPGVRVVGFQDADAFLSSLAATRL